MKFKFADKVSVNLPFFYGKAGYVFDVRCDSTGKHYDYRIRFTTNYDDEKLTLSHDDWYGQEFIDHWNLQPGEEDTSS